MNKIYKVRVNNIMVPFIPEEDSFMNDNAQPMYLKSFEMYNNILWDGAERDRRTKEFETYQRGFIGTGYTLLMANDEGSLTEYYTGLEVVPIQAIQTKKFESNLGDSMYYTSDDITSSEKLHVPVDLTQEIVEDKALEAISMLFNQRQTAKQDIIDPLLKRQESISSKNINLNNNITK